MSSTVVRGATRCTLNNPCKPKPRNSAGCVRTPHTKALRTSHTTREFCCCNHLNIDGKAFVPSGAEERGFDQEPCSAPSCDRRKSAALKSSEYNRRFSDPARPPRVPASEQAGIGGATVEQLLLRSAQVRAVVRDKAKAQEKFEGMEGVEVAVCDLNNDNDVLEVSILRFRTYSVADTDSFHWQRRV
eukprot:1176329-Prorocentrum_minimum.AAC.1